DPRVRARGRHPDDQGRRPGGCSHQPGPRRGGQGRQVPRGPLLPAERRRRDGDIPALAAHFIDKYAQAYGKTIKGLTPGTLNAMLAHDWPGNVRELENAIERAIVLCKGPELTADDLPATLRGPRPAMRDAGALIPGASLAEIEREAILKTLELVDGSTTRAAE